MSYNLVKRYKRHIIRTTIIDPYRYTKESERIFLAKKCMRDNAISNRVRKAYEDTTFII